MRCGLEISLGGIKTMDLSKPGKPCKQPKLLVGSTELEGVPKSCHLRSARAMRPDMESVDRDSEAQTTEAAVSWGKTEVEPAWPCRAAPECGFIFQQLTEDFTGGFRAVFT